MTPSIVPAPKKMVLMGGEVSAQAAVSEKINESLGKEAYRLKIADGRIEIEGGRLLEAIGGNLSENGGLGENSCG